MAEATVLETVKNMLGVTGTYQDATMSGYIDEVKQYMLSAGVSEDVVESSTSAGTIARGVADLWNYGAGAGELSPYFKERVIQLALRSKSSGGGTDTPETEDGKLKLLSTYEHTGKAETIIFEDFGEMQEIQLIPEVFEASPEDSNMGLFLFSVNEHNNIAGIYAPTKYENIITGCGVVVDVRGFVVTQIDILPVSTFTVGGGITSVILPVPDKSITKITLVPAGLNDDVTVRFKLYGRA